MTTFGFSSAYLRISHAQQAAQAQILQSTQRLASGLRVNSAADDPSAIGRIESLKSQINETTLLRSFLPQSTEVLTQIRTSLQSLQELAGTAKDGTTTDLQALVSALRTAAGEDFGTGVNPLGGDITDPEQITTTYPATSTTAQGSTVAAQGGTVTIGGGVRRLDVEVGGTVTSVTLQNGTYSAQGLASEVQRAFTAAGIDVSVGLDASTNSLDFTVNTPGATSFAVSGNAAAVVVGAGGYSVTEGTDEVTETVDGPNGPLSFTTGGSTVIYSNLIKYADMLENALQGGSSAQISDALESVTSMLENNSGKTQAVLNLSESKDLAMGRKIKTLSEALENLQGADVTEETYKLAKAQVHQLYLDKLSSDLITFERNRMETLLQGFQR